MLQQLCVTHLGDAFVVINFEDLGKAHQLLSRGVGMSGMLYSNIAECSVSCLWWNLLWGLMEMTEGSCMRGDCQLSSHKAVFYVYDITTGSCTMTTVR
jgi:hypothetical protein